MEKTDWRMVQRSDKLGAPVRMLRPDPLDGVAHAFVADVANTTDTTLRTSLARLPQNEQRAPLAT